MEDIHEFYVKKYLDHKDLSYGVKSCHSIVSLMVRHLHLHGNDRVRSPAIDMIVRDLGLECVSGCLNCIRAEVKKKKKKSLKVGDDKKSKS